MDISGRAAVVTGGASGIGQAVARRIFADGGNVIIFDLNAEAGAAMVEEMGSDRCLFAEVNVADEASVEAGDRGREAVQDYVRRSSSDR